MMFFQPYLHLLLFFLSFTVTPPTIAKYAKTGCINTCGNVIIPYPFGIGANCSINRWYTVDCNYSTPYLTALNDLEVLDVDLIGQMVTVNAPMISNCQNRVGRSTKTIMSIDLHGSPFLFSKPNNNFVFEGCGVAIMIADNGSVVTGCSTACLNVTPSDRNNCFGNGCCQTENPHYLKSYSINITSFDGGCGSASLVEDKTSYQEGSFSHDKQFIFKNNSVIPLSLLWTLTDHDQVTCCDNDPMAIRKVDMFNGDPIDTWKCYSTRYYKWGNIYVVVHP